MAEPDFISRYSDWASRFCVLCPRRWHYLFYTRQISNLSIALKGDTIFIFQCRHPWKENRELRQTVPLLANRANIREAHGALSPNSIHRFPLLLSFWHPSPWFSPPLCSFIILRAWGLSTFLLLSLKKSLKNSFLAMKGFHMIFSGNRSISINSLVQLCIQCLY